MKYSEMFSPTLREVPAEAEIISHQLMLRAGLMRKVAAGIYSYLPLGWRVMRKIMDIIREEMDASGCQELMFPIAMPAELWQKSGRWEVYGDELWRVKDRHGRDFCLGPTHEEVVTDLVASEVKSYKQLPLLLYQIQDKFRDERRPRFGLMRGREFVMKDCYSFDRDDAGLGESYRKMYEAYMRIFRRCGLDFRPVEADNGAIGGSSSHEFMVLAESGECEILYCDTCDYAANIEIAVTGDKPKADSEPMGEVEKVLTPNCKTIEAVAEYLHLSKEKSLKALCFMGDEEMCLIFLRGDRRLNEIRMQNYLGCKALYMATEEELQSKGLTAGYIGPCGIDHIRILVDNELKNARNLVCGANEEGYHLKNVNPGRDFQGEFGDFRLVEVGETCPHCAGKLQNARGIEVGQVFKLGTKYSVSMGATFLDEAGKANPMVMGCYGIGVGRSMAAAIEQNYDDHGIIWPYAIAPYQVIIVPISEKNENQMAVAGELYQSLIAKGYEVILDDRAERAGVKFNDADLLGIPIRITIGDKSLAENKVEVKVRKTGENRKIDLSVLCEEVEKIAAALA